MDTCVVVSISGVSVGNSDVAVLMAGGELLRLAQGVQGRLQIRNIFRATQAYKR